MHPPVADLPSACATRRGLATLLAAFALIALGACSTAPRHPALVAAQQADTLPPLLPVRRFVANIDAEGGHQVSPDGRQLLWLRAVGLDIGLATRPVAAPEAVRTWPTGNMGRGGGSQYWLADSRHIVFTRDPSGDENVQLWVQDTRGDSFAPWEVQPGRGVRNLFTGRGEPGSACFFFVSNRRDRASMDLLEADATTRGVREVARNDGSVLEWLIDTDRQLAGRVRQLGREDGAPRVVELLQPDGSWRALRQYGGFDVYWVHRIDRSDAARPLAWVTHNLGRDKSALHEVNLATGEERVLAQHAVVDIGNVLLPPGRGAPLASITEPDHPRIDWLDAAWERDMSQAVARARERGLVTAAPVIARPQSMADDGRVLVLRSVSDFDAAELLVDRASGSVTRLNPRNEDAQRLLSAEEPFSFSASDGRRIHGYLVRPRGVNGPAPLVVQIHGGPWARDSWAPAVFNSVQLMANRGYAVLMVNYRGSWGYGRDHVWAADGQFGTRLQQDIAEAAQWAIDRGVADPQRMAVIGASFGGYSTLTQLIQKRHAWRCGVDIVGVANWPRVVENWPPFWRNRHWFARTFGDVNDPVQRARMLEQSPISRVGEITVPLLVVHGRNDVRVLAQDSDDVVAELRRLGRPVSYLTFDNEGHSISRWRNRLALWREVEDHLAACLGGRSAGFDYYQLMPR